MKLALVDIDKLARFDELQYDKGLEPNPSGQWTEHDGLKTNVDVEAFVASLLGSIIDKRPSGYDKYGPFAQHEITKTLKEML